jgi:diguanylate cyclase (GGDEF)-like protein
MQEVLAAETEPRSAAIKQLNVLARIADPALQGMTRLAAYVAGASSAAIHIIGPDSQHRIAGYAAPLGDHPVTDSMCRLVVESGEAIVVSDAVADGRFSYSSFVHGERPVRFYASFPLRTGEGEIVGTVCAFDTHDIKLGDQAVRLLEDISIQASTHLGLMRLVGELGANTGQDELTGAASRVTLGDRLAYHLARLNRHDIQVVVATIRLDGVEDITANLGDGAGDRILQEIARRLAGSVRDEDLVARIGSHEFVVVAELPGEGVKAESFQERLTMAVSRPFTVRGKLVDIGIGVGAVTGRRGESAEEILARADEESGRHPISKL